MWRSNAPRCLRSLMLGYPPAMAAFATRCPTVLLHPLHLPLLYRKAILEPAKFSNVDLFLIPLPVISSCRSYLMYLRQPDVTDEGTEIASTSAKIGLTSLPELSHSGLFPSRLRNLPPPRIKPAGLFPPSSPSHSGLPFPWSDGGGIVWPFYQGGTSGATTYWGCSSGEQGVFTVSAELEAMTWFYSVWEKSTHRMRRIYLIICFSGVRKCLQVSQMVSTF